MRPVPLLLGQHLTNLLPPLDEEADGRVGVPEGLEDGRALDVAAVDVVHAQDAVVHTEKKHNYFTPAFLH